MDYMDIQVGDIVECGAYGHKIYVCSIEDEKRFWGTDELEEYEKGQNARGWFFNICNIEAVIGNVDDDDDDEY